MDKKTVSIKEVILTVIIAIVCGIVYKVWGPVYDAVGAFTGFFDQLIYGVWFIASIIAAYIIRKPGVAFFAEVAASAGELFAGAGLMSLTSGVLQGLGAELVLLAFRYRRWDLTALMAMSVGATIGSFVDVYLFWGYAEKTVFVQVMSIVLRIVGSLFVCGWLGKFVVDALVKTGTLNSYAIVRSEQQARWEK